MCRRARAVGTRALSACVADPCDAGCCVSGVHASGHPHASCCNRRAHAPPSAVASSMITWRAASRFPARATEGRLRRRVGHKCAGERSRGRWVTHEGLRRKARRAPSDSEADGWRSTAACVHDRGIPERLRRPIARLAAPRAGKTLWAPPASSRSPGTAPAARPARPCAANAWRRSRAVMGEVLSK